MKTKHKLNRIIRKYCHNNLGGAYVCNVAGEVLAYWDEEFELLWFIFNKTKDEKEKEILAEFIN
jgi:hypothetical protein